MLAREHIITSPCGRTALALSNPVPLSRARSMRCLATSRLGDTLVELFACPMVFRHSRRRFSLAVALVCSIALSGPLHGQTSAPPAQNAPAPALGRDVSWLQLPSNVLHDQKNIWLFPVHAARKRELLPTFAVMGVTAGLIATDPHDTPTFRTADDFRGFNNVFSGRTTGLVTTFVPISIYAAGLLRKDSYQQKTALLAGEALADSLILSTVMKVSTRRFRPSDISPQGDFGDTFFARQNSPSSTSFPSGHTIAAFSLATIIARRYGNHRWVPWVAYGAAGVIAFSRITLQAHFPSDVFLGAALGYSISRFAVLGP